MGAVILVVLAAILAWVVWRGAHPDPSLFMLETDLSQGAVSTAADRGPVPSGLAGTGWTEGAISTFDYDNLWEKIDGREGYYKAFGFERLYFVSIIRDDDPATAVDVELYDLGTAANAVGAYAGERPPDVAPEIGETGLSHVDRNTLMMTRGRYYLRALGSEESPAVVTQLEHLRARFNSELAGEALPWGFALFVGRMGMPPGSVSYALENAFSFGFAANVYSATLDDGDTEVYVTPAADDAGARELAEQFRGGFLQYGEPAGESVGVQWIRDRYLGSIAGARAAGPWVVGVRGAPDMESAARELEALAAATVDFPLPEARPSTPPATRELRVLDEYADPEEETSDEH